MKKLLAIILTSFMALAVVGPTVSANTSDFRFRSFEADYYLSRDNDNRSTLRTRETFVAEFPNSDQNHGIERAIPKTYDGHPVDLRIISVNNQSQGDVPYSTRSSNGNLILRIGDADTYVHGQQTYVIEYTARDVTKAFDTGDEFYWDTNGTGWQQSFDRVTARLHIAENIASAQQDKFLCFTGAQKANNTDCQVTVNAGGELVHTVTTTRPLQPGENLTMVTSFDKGTFAKYVAPPTPLWQKVLFGVLIIIVPLWYAIIPIVAFVRALKRWRAEGRDAAGRGTIIPQYAPPIGVPVVVADTVLHDRMHPRAVSATIVDLAVRHYIKIYQVDKKDYELELLRSPADLQPDEQKIVDMLFGNGSAIGNRTALKNKKDLYTKVTNLSKTVYARAITDGLMVDTVAQQKRMNVWGIVLLVVSLFTLSILGVAAAIAVLIFAHNMPARTVRGVELRDYLLGTRDYMKLAEADRIKTLQSPQGAEKVDIDDNAQLVKLYEKLLPLAMLFGIEKDWAKQFADLYQQPPDWYQGNWSTFNAAVFASSLDGFGSNVTNNSFTPPSSSSSSGTGGGGFSGGGGGGGGGGGW